MCVKSCTAVDVLNIGRFIYIATTTLTVTYLLLIEGNIGEISVSLQCHRRTVEPKLERKPLIF